jgi:hypothetical protein
MRLTERCPARCSPSKGSLARAAESGVTTSTGCLSSRWRELQSVSSVCLAPYLVRRLRHGLCARTHGLRGLQQHRVGLARVNSTRTILSCTSLRVQRTRSRMCSIRLRLPKQTSPFEPPSHGVSWPYGASNDEQRPAPCLHDPAVLRLQVFSTS